MWVHLSVRSQCRSWTGSVIYRKIQSNCVKISMFCVLFLLVVHLSRSAKFYTVTEALVPKWAHKIFMLKDFAWMWGGRSVWRQRGELLLVLFNHFSLDFWCLCVIEFVNHASVNLTVRGCFHLFTLLYHLVLLYYYYWALKTLFHLKHNQPWMILFITLLLFLCH